MANVLKYASSTRNLLANKRQKFIEPVFITAHNDEGFSTPTAASKSARTPSTKPVLLDFRLKKHLA